MVFKEVRVKFNFSNECYSSTNALARISYKLWVEAGNVM